MYFKDVINLISVTKSQGTNGYPVTTETATEVFANAKSVTRSEFYEALRAGITQTIAFDVFVFDYDGQTFVDYNNKRYKVERAYVKDNEIMELNCSEVK